MNTRLRSDRGQALMEVMIASAVMMVATLATFGVLQSQSKETRALNQKINAIEAQRTLTMLMTDSSVCQQMIKDNTLTIDAGAVKGEVQVIPNGSAKGASALFAAKTKVSNTAPDLIVQRIYFDDLQSTATPDQYLAWLRVAFDPGPLVRQIQPLGVRFTLTTDPVTKKVNGCINNGSSAAGATITATSPGGKCTVIQRDMIRGGPGVGPASLGWTSMAITCPSSFPVAVSVNTTPAAYASAWAAHYQTSSPPGYFVAGICDMMFLKDDPRVPASVVAAHPDPSTDRGVCAVACCDL